MRNRQPTSLFRVHATSDHFSLALLLIALMLPLCACNTGPDPSGQDIPLPSLGENRQRPAGVFALIQRADIPLNQPTDAAWAIINEAVVPTLTRGAWRGNGMRIGLLRRDQLDAYAQAMPQPVAFNETLINRSAYYVPIIETPRMRGDLLFELDLTRPPMPRHVENIAGGKNSTLRLLARIETEADGRHTLVLTPHHFVPSPLDLIPRDPLEKELDGRVFEELTVRLTLEKDQVAVVGLYWPWPDDGLLEAEEEQAAQTRGPSTASPRERPVRAVVPIAPADPAAPPAHITQAQPGTIDRPAQGDAQGPDAPDSPDGEAQAPDRLAPPLPANFGSTLFTGTRIRQPIRAVLLITIEKTPARDLAPPE